MTAPGVVSRIAERPSPARISAITLLALVAFASNSILCRLALLNGAIDPASFTTVRLISGAVVLAGLSMRGRVIEAGTWSSAAALAIYAVTFSFAYVTLNAGIGALLLFGAVQATIIVGAVRAGERPSWMESLGLAGALAGLAYLVTPRLSMAPLASSIMMIASGIAWGIYTLRGRGVVDPLRTTSGNFARSVPLIIAFSGAMLTIGVRPSISPLGFVLAFVSGSVTSGLGYIAWYAALRHLTRVRAATVQLAVPVLTAAGGIAFLGERLTFRLVVAAALILGGIGLAVRSRG